MRLVTFIKLLLLLAIGGGGYQYWQGHKAAGGSLAKVFGDDAVSSPVPLVSCRCRCRTE